MTASKVSVSLDSAVVEHIRTDVAEGRAESVSAWINEAGRERIEKDDLARVLAEIFEETGGPVTDDELAEARQRIAAAEQA